MVNQFNQIQCPLCGRNVSIKTFDPSGFVNDIIGILMVGLGYARGFGVAEKGSILDSDDPILDLIANRVIEISRFLMDAGIITENMLAYHLPVLEANIEAQAKLESEVDALEVDIEELRQNNTFLKNEVVKLGSEVDALEVDVEELEHKNAGLKNQAEELRADVEELRAQLEESMALDDGETDKIEELTSMVEKVIGQEFYDQHEKEENAFINLKNMLAYVLNEYEALVE